jgi:FdhD protein
MTGSIRAIELLRVGSRSSEHRGDRVAAEEPLEIRLCGTPLLVTMRTPGRDRDLVAGFLLAERIVRSADDIDTIRHCTRDDDSSDEQNVVDVLLGEDAMARAGEQLAARRLAPVTSACGVCGRRTIDDLLGRIAPLAGTWTVTRDAVLAWPGRLRHTQTVFDETGGLHAAALFDAAGVCAGVAEDVGRHNAVDKVVGAELLAERMPLSDRALFVSGRSSFEIVQKAFVAGIPIVASVSAPSSLAIDLARSAGVTLLGFVRDGSFNVYSGVERVDMG